MSLWQISRWPLAIAVLTLSSLVAGLVSDGWGDALAAAGLSLPAALALRLSTRHAAARDAESGPSQADRGAA